MRIGPETAPRPRGRQRAHRRCRRRRRRPVGDPGLGRDGPGGRRRAARLPRRRRRRRRPAAAPGAAVAITGACVRTLASAQVKGRVRSSTTLTALDVAIRERATELFVRDVNETDHTPAGPDRPHGAGAVRRLHARRRGAVRPDAGPAGGRDRAGGRAVSDRRRDHDVEDLRPCCEGVVPAGAGDRRRRRRPQRHVPLVRARRRPRAHRAVEPVLLQDRAQRHGEPSCVAAPHRPPRLRRVPGDARSTSAPIGTVPRSRRCAGTSTPSPRCRACRTCSGCGRPTCTASCTSSDVRAGIVDDGARRRRRAPPPVVPAEIAELSMRLGRAPDLDTLVATALRGLAELLGLRALDPRARRRDRLPALHDREPRVRGRGCRLRGRGRRRDDRRGRRPVPGRARRRT